MVDESSESTKTSETFRFASGQILTLDEDQIGNIPYLTAMVSSADRFESARDEDGHYKLDPNIDYEHFSVILQSLPFDSARQFFTRLPEQNNIIPIIALLNFLGLASQPDPTLCEIDSAFFSTVIYRPDLSNHLRIVRPIVMQDIAARFAIAIFKEAYEFTQCEVMDQIYWYVMFILSTSQWFGPRLRHHVNTIAGNCFSLFNPSLFKRLQKLKRPRERETRPFWNFVEEKNSFDEENDPLFRQTLRSELDDPPNTSSYSWQCVREFWRRRRSSTYQYDYWFPHRSARLDRDLLKPIYKHVLEIMYERLQSAVCQSAIAELRQQNGSHKSVQNRVNSSPLFDIFERETLPKKIADIFQTELVQEEIRALILEEICSQTPNLEQKHAELVKSIRKYEQNVGVSHEHTFLLFHWIFSDSWKYENEQKETLCYELLLDKLHQDPHTVVEQLQKRVLDGLYEVALDQFNKWEKTQRDIDQLISQLNQPQRSNKSSYIKSKKPMHQRYQLLAQKPLLKRQFKCSTR